MPAASEMGASIAHRAVVGWGREHLGDLMGELSFRRVLDRAQLFRDEPAVLDLGNGYEATYAEQLERVERLCAVLRGLGLRSSDRVAVLAGASHVYVELWHAALAGAAVINPLNTRLAPDEIVYILNDSSTEVIFVDAGFAKQVDEIRERVPALRRVVLIGSGDVPHDDRLDDLMEVAKPFGLPAEADDGDAAVLIYTGGTTGLPKGVVLAQRAIVLTLYRLHMVGRFRQDQSFLSFMPMFHIGGIGSWGTFRVSGGRTVLMPAFEPAAVNAVIRDQRISCTGAVPTMLAMMIQHPDFAPSMLASLELVIYGAAPMPPELLATLMKINSKLSFLQAYGMTECAATATALLPEDHHRGGTVLRSVGRPLPGVELDIRDPESGAPIGQGETGEIWLRCDSNMNEYWQKPEQTASSLVNGWYRTGDAGHLDEQGFLFLADRVKDMIVAGGENVYSLEVENAISSHPAVGQVAVIGLPDAVWGERVHAVVVCEPGSVSSEELDAHARTTIAGFKVPRGWTFQSEPLPLSAAGKVLKRALREQLTPASS